MAPRHFILLPLLAVLAACAQVPPPPSNLDDACTIARERPQWLKAMRKAERKWGVPVHSQMAFIYQESKFRGDARTPLRFELGVIPMGRQSSAYGYAQALDATWARYKRETGRRSARRDDIADATDFMGWYMNVTRERVGIPLDAVARQYIAYHEGHAGYLRGRWKRKRWLRRIAREIAARDKIYARQLQACGLAG